MTESQSVRRQTAREAWHWTTHHRDTHERPRTRSVPDRKRTASTTARLSTRVWGAEQTRPRRL